MADKEVSEDIKRAYRDRLKFLRLGQEAFQAREISKGIQGYATYLKSLASFLGVEEKRLDPSLFDLQRDKAELLLISQVYWDLSKAYDKSPSGQNETSRCLGQFVKFTAGFKHQHINSQLIKRYVRQKKAVNHDAFKEALKEILIKSKGCFVATYALGDGHPTTNMLREIKFKVLQKSKLGRLFISTYYYLSPKLIERCEQSPHVGSFLKKVLFLPLINIFLKIFNKKSRTC